MEEEVVEETVTEETVTEEVEVAPDSHEQFVSLLVDMGLSAEQAEAVHEMAMELADAGGGEVIEEEVKEEVKVEASRQRRPRRSRRGMRRSEFGREAQPQRRELSQEEVMEKRLTRLERQNRSLRNQLREFGAAPATRPLRNAPSVDQGTAAPKPMNKNTAAAMDMINNYGK